MGSEGCNSPYFKYVILSGSIDSNAHKVNECFTDIGPNIDLHTVVASHACMSSN